MRKQHHPTEGGSTKRKGRQHHPKGAAFSVAFLLFLMGGGGAFFLLPLRVVALLGGAAFAPLSPSLLLSNRNTVRLSLMHTQQPPNTVIELQVSSASPVTVLLNMSVALTGGRTWKSVSDSFRWFLTARMDPSFSRPDRELSLCFSCGHDDFEHVY